MTATCLAMRLLTLAKEGTTKEQVDRSTSYPEVKTILKAKQHSKWKHKQSRYNKADSYYLFTRREQVTVFRLRTGHSRLNYHLYSKLRIGHTEQCPCGTGSQTTEHLLQFCATYEPLRKGIWPDHTPVARKLYGSLRDLQCTATFIGETGVSVWRTRRRRLDQEVRFHPLISPAQGRHLTARQLRQIRLHASNICMPFVFIHCLFAVIQWQTISVNVRVCVCVCVCMCTHLHVWCTIPPPPLPLSPSRTVSVKVYLQGDENHNHHHHQRFRLTLFSCHSTTPQT